jgi:branched-chain amino acid aminotransferase
MDALKKIWIDGKLLDWKDANVHILTHTLHYGSGAFEGIRCYNTKKGPAVFRLKEHIERLYKSADALLMKVPYSRKEMEKVIFEVIKSNELKECYIRPIIYFGYGSMGLNTIPCPVNVSVVCWKWGAYLGEEGLKKGITTKVSVQKRLVGPLNKAKICGNYFVSSLAKREALSAGFDEAIMLDTNGNVAEGSGENIFVVKNKNIYTPKEGAILLGITRDSAMTIARDLGYDVIEKELKVSDLYSADEIFFTGTAAEVTPVRQVDDEKISEGIGPISSAIQKKFFETIKNAEPHGEWFTLVK